MEINNKKDIRGIGKYRFNWSDIGFPFKKYFVDIEIPSFSRIIPILFLAGFLFFGVNINSAYAAIAFDATSESHTGTVGSASQTSFSWTHTPVGTPKGVLIFIWNDGTTAQTTSVTYGGVNVPVVTGAAAVDTSGETGRMTAYFLGSGLPTGAQTITVNRNNTATELWATAATVTAGTSYTEVYLPGIVLLQEDGTLAEQSVTDGSPGTNSLRFAGAYSGLASVPAAGANSTVLNGFDTGNFVGQVVRETTAGQGARNVGFSSGTSDDRAVVHLAVREATVTTTLGDGTDGGNSTIGPGAAATEIDRFSLSTNVSTDTVTGLTVTLAGNASAYTNIATVGVYTTGGVLKCSATPSSNTVALTTCGIAVTTTPTDYVVKITPKTHANMPAVPGASYNTTATVTSITVTNSKTGTDTDSATITVDNASPAGVTSSTATAGNTVVDLAWTNPVDSDYVSNGTAVVLRDTSAVTNAPAEGSVFWPGDPVGTAIVACVDIGSPPFETCQDSGLTNGTAYHYKIFTQDSRGNFNAGTVPTGSPATPAAPTTTLGDGTDGGNSTIGPGAAATEIDRFSLSTNVSTDTVTGLTVTLAGNASAYTNIATVGVYTTGDVLKCSATPSSNTVALTTCGISVTTTPTDYVVKITPKTHANMPAVPGASYAITATVTAITATNSTAGTDTDSATITVDNASPAGVTSSTATAGDTVVDLAWTNPVDSDFTTGGTTVVLRDTSAVADVPVEGTTYTVGNTIGTATVACVVTGSPPTETCQDTGLTNGTAYHYKIFTQDSRGNYDAGTVPTGSPATPAASSQAITVGNISTTTTSKTFSHNNNGDYLIVGVVTGYSGNATAATYAGTSMTKLGQLTAGASGENYSVTVWGLANPAQGSNNAVVTYAGSYYSIGAMSFSGVDQVNPVRATSTASNSTGSTPSVTVSSAVDDLVVDVVGVRFSSSYATGAVGSGQTERMNLENGATNLNSVGLMSTEPGAASVTMDWSMSVGSNPWKAIAVSLRPASSVTLSQLHYLWRNDDGSEINASNLYLEDNAVPTTQNVNLGTRKRLRFSIDNTGASTATDYQFKLEQSSSSCSTWYAVPTSDSGQKGWVMDLSNNLADLSSTTDLTALSNPASGSFTAGYVMTSSNPSGKQTLTSTQFTELEYAIRSTANAETGLLYCFRLTNNGSTEGFTYTTQPQITLSSFNRHGGGGEFESVGSGPIITGGGPGGGSGIESGGTGGSIPGGGASGGGDVGIYKISNYIAYIFRSIMLDNKVKMLVLKLNRKN